MSERPLITQLYRRAASRIRDCVAERDARMIKVLPIVRVDAIVRAMAPMLMNPPDRRVPILKTVQGMLMAAASAVLYREIVGEQNVAELYAAFEPFIPLAALA